MNLLRKKRQAMLRKSSLEESTSTKTSVTTLHSMLLEINTHDCYRSYEVRHFLNQIHIWIFTQDGVQGRLLLNTLQTFVKLRRLSEHICILRNPWLNNIVRNPWLNDIVGMEIHGISFFLRFSFFLPDTFFRCLGRIKQQ